MAEGRGNPIVGSSDNSGAVSKTTKDLRIGRRDEETKSPRDGFTSPATPLIQTLTRNSACRVCLRPMVVIFARGGLYQAFSGLSARDGEPLHLGDHSVRLQPESGRCAFRASDDPVGFSQRLMICSRSASFRVIALGAHFARMHPGHRQTASVRPPGVAGLFPAKE